MKKKVVHVKVTFRGCDHIAVVEVGECVEPPKNAAGNGIPGLEDAIMFITEDTNLDDWLKVAHEKFTDHDFAFVDFEKPITISGMYYAGSPFEEGERIAKCYSVREVEHAVAKLQDEHPEVKNVKVFGGSEDCDVYLNGIYTVNQIVKCASKLTESA